MTLVPITSRVNREDKKNFDIFCDSVGINPSVAINMFIKAVLRERRIPFDITEPDPFYNSYNQAVIFESLKELKEGKGKPHELIEVEDE